MIQKMDAVLAKFDQAVKNEVKKRDYRSAFTDLQRRLHDERAMTYQEQAMKKYKPENPWDRWRPQMSVQLNEKVLSCHANDPLKITATSPIAVPGSNNKSNWIKKESNEVQVHSQVPKQAEKGKLVNFKFGQSIASGEHTVD